MRISCPGAMHIIRGKAAIETYGPIYEQQRLLWTGSRGTRNPDDVLITDENAVTIFACKEDQAQKVLNELQPAMKGFGGMCLISDCHAQTSS